VSGLPSLAPPARAPTPRRRMRLRIAGAVQGVGFRPFVYRLARSLDLTGFVENSSEGVTIEVEGEPARIADLQDRLRAEAPPRAAIAGIHSEALLPQAALEFEIRESSAVGAKTAAILPDAATCPDCLRELDDPADRRFRYPFINCTSCGPRYSIVLGIPYDRERTTMARFELCGRCREEYQDPRDRRFHAEPNACPDCGPHLEAWDESGHVLATHDAALVAAVASIRKGRVVALKGIGGFHLLVDARDDDAVRRLRQRKRRDARPFAVMAPSMDWVRETCFLEEAEERLVTSVEAPIVLVRARAGAVAPSVAPGSPSVGVMLPYSPLHHLLLQELGFPVVATSGNASDEPMCIDEYEALVRLSSIASLFVVHDRPIAHRVDDSVARVVSGRPMLLRRGRGYAPLSLSVANPLPATLALGAHQKNTVAVALDRQIVLGPHVGDLDSLPALEGFRDSVSTLRTLYGIEPDIVACDLHPDYASSQEAREEARRRSAHLVTVQHHHAHILAAMADQGIEAPVVGFAWDGSGYGGDGTVWGGETLRILDRGFERVASLRTFCLPGGEKAVREPRRSALGVLFALLGEAAFDHPVWRRARLFSDADSEVLRRMLVGGVNCPVTSSVGRLFDAVAALAGLGRISSYEGQAAMALEAAVGSAAGDASYPLSIETAADGRLVIDWGPAIQKLLADLLEGVAPADIALRFHNALAEIVVAVSRRLGASRVVLTGGCFQNRYLAERAIAGLRRAAIEPIWHERIPPNDGGIAVGQILAASRAPDFKED
jgi:hydrogenase maturation protein HypF